MTPNFSSSESSSSQRLETPEAAQSVRRIRSSAMKEAEESFSNGHANGHTNDSAKAGQISGTKKGYKIDYTDHFEFGGTPGVLALMIGFPLLMYYMWAGATYYDGKLPLPAEGQSLGDFIKHLYDLCYKGAFPSLKAWAIYWLFFIFEGLCYMFLPGVTVKGKPLEHLGGKQLVYYCSAAWSFYTTIVVAIALHFSGLFRLDTVINEFGPLMSVAIITGIVISFIAYFSAIARGAQHRCTGYPIYDFFMGAELNPSVRHPGSQDVLRGSLAVVYALPHLVGRGSSQWETYGYVSGEVGFLLLAHFLYANACSKGEELITPTWYAFRTLR